MQALADFMAKVRGNKVKFASDKIVLTAGATSANEILMFCLTEPGDAFLVPTPYYPGYVHTCSLDLLTYTIQYIHIYMNAFLHIIPFHCGLILIIIECVTYLCDEIESNITSSMCHLVIHSIVGVAGLTGILNGELGLRLFP